MEKVDEISNLAR